MRKNAWTDELRTGIKSIDDQHREFLTAISGVIEAIGSNGERNGILRSLKDIHAAVNRHFKTEEKFMEGSSYPDAAGHIRLHNEFQKEFLRLASRVYNGETGLKFSKEFRERVADWCVLHIKKNDFKLASYLKAEEAENNANRL